MMLGNPMVCYRRRVDEASLSSMAKKIPMTKGALDAQQRRVEDAHERGRRCQS